MLSWEWIPLSSCGLVNLTVYSDSFHVFAFNWPGFSGFSYCTDMDIWQETPTQPINLNLQLWLEQKCKFYFSRLPRLPCSALDLSRRNAWRWYRLLRVMFHLIRTFWNSSGWSGSTIAPSFCSPSTAQRPNTRYEKCEILNQEQIRDIIRGYKWQQWSQLIYYVNTCINIVLTIHGFLTSDFHLREHWMLKDDQTHCR